MGKPNLWHTFTSFSCVAQYYSGTPGFESQFSYMEYDLKHITLLCRSPHQEKELIPRETVRIRWDEGVSTVVSMCRKYSKRLLPSLLLHPALYPRVKKYLWGLWISLSFSVCVCVCCRHSYVEVRGQRYRIGGLFPSWILEIKLRSWGLRQTLSSAKPSQQTNYPPPPKKSNSKF